MLTAEYQWRFHSNRTLTLREKVGAMLRALAWRIDGRISLAIDIQTTPPLNFVQKLECIQFGLGQMKVAVNDTTRDAACERILDVVMKRKHGTPT